MLDFTRLRASCKCGLAGLLLATSVSMISGCATAPRGGCASPAYMGANGGQGCATGGPMPYTIDPSCSSGACGTEGCSPGGNCTPGGGCGVCDVPRELRKVSLPDYRIEPPDVLLIEAASNLRPANDPIGAGEVVLVTASNTTPITLLDSRMAQQFKTIDGPYVIGTDGYLNLGPEYGKVLCAGQPLAEIQRRIEIHLKRMFDDPKVLVTLSDPSAKQQVSGQHLVRPDGTVGLGIYGGVYVAGMTLAEAKFAIEQHLAQHMHMPQISIDVLGYNSKSYYVIAEGGGAGQNVYKMPATGNETVLDVISQIKGLPTVSDEDQIWIARPNPDGCSADQRLYVDWRAISQGGDTCTNYQIFPGDRLYVKADKWITFDTHLAKITAPLERILGFALLGNGVVRGFQQGSSAFGGNGGGF